MKIIQTFLAPLFLLFAGLSYAQTSVINYIYFDEACMQQYDYEKSADCNELGFTDYHISVSPNQRYLFRVIKLNTYKELQGTFTDKAISCADLRLITPTFVSAVNRGDKEVYMVLKEGDQFAIYDVKEVVLYAASSSSLAYKDSNRQLNYVFKDINKGADLDSTDLGQVLFVGMTKNSCLDKRQFRVFSNIKRGPASNLFFLENLGLESIQFAKGHIRLTSVNKRPLEDLVQELCKETVPLNDTALVENPEEKLTKDSSTVGRSSSKPTKGSRLDNPFGPKRTKKPSYKQGPTDSARIAVLNTPELFSQGYYYVQEGDNLYRIATKFNTREDVIIGLNNLKSDVLKIGRKIKIKNDGSYTDPNPILRKDPDNPNTLQKVHIVRQGETLWDVAQKYGLKMKDIIQMNNLQTEKLKLRQELIVGQEGVGK